MIIVKKLAVATLIAGSTIFFSGCNEPLTPPIKRTIDKALPSVESSSVKFIPDYTSVALEWGSVRDPRIEGYWIYRSNMNLDGTKMKRVAQINSRYSNHHLDEKLEPNMKYAYRITAVNAKGIESVETEPLLVQTLPLFESVSLIEAISDLPRQIKIQWRPHQSDRISHYILERLNPEKSEWKQIAKIDNRFIVEHIDKNLGDNQTHMYRLKAVTFDGIESIPSTIVTATTKPLPEHISELKATKDLPRKIQLTWGPSASSDVVAYNIYRSSSVDGSYSKIAKLNIDFNLFDDVVNEDGKIYFYKITTLDKDNLESKLEESKPEMGQTLDKPAMPYITLAQQHENKIILNWKAMDDRAVTYNIYKVKVESWTSSKETIIPSVDGLRFEDLDVARGIEYRYSIQSVDKYGLASPRSKESIIRLPALEKPAGQ